MIVQPVVEPMDSFTALIEMHCTIPDPVHGPGLGLLLRPGALHVRLRAAGAGLGGAGGRPHRVPRRQDPHQDRLLPPVPQRGRHHHRARQRRHGVGEGPPQQEHVARVRSGRCVAENIFNTTKDMRNT